MEFSTGDLQQGKHVLAGSAVQVSGRLYIVSTEEEPPAGRRPLVVFYSLSLYL